MSADECIAAAVAKVDFGKATARKGGRNPQWPYVPVLDHGTHTEQIRKRAFETREEAIYHAELTIECRRGQLAKQLGERRFRALREDHGLPRELDDLR